MSKKHFIWAANEIANKCFTEGITTTGCETYWAYLTLFQEFSEEFNVFRFNGHIENKIEELKK